MNLDQRSARLNTEMGLIIDSPELAKGVIARFESLTQPKNAYEVSLSAASTDGRLHLSWKTEEHGALVEYRHEPARSCWQRLKARLFMLAPIDDEL